jgi:tetratricopeptide (TPR) repeat protein
LDRVVAVISAFDHPSGFQIGSGYLLAGDLVLTAGHCVRHLATGAGPREVKVVRAASKDQAAAVSWLLADDPSGPLDVAVLRLEDRWIAETLPATRYTRLDRHHSGMLSDCEAIGFPEYETEEKDPARRHHAELHGVIYQTDGAGTGRLLLREPVLPTLAPPGESGSIWGGLSGAMVFHAGAALGVIVEHHPRQGPSAVQLVPFDEIAKRRGDPRLAPIANLIGLPDLDSLPWAVGAAISAVQVVVGELPGEPAAFVARETVHRLEEAMGGGRVPVVCALTGLRGVGKTQVAAGYARARIREGWGLVAWVNAESTDTLLASLAKVADQIPGVADPEGDSLRSAERLREHLQARTDPGLLVFDNATDPDQLRVLLPATGGTQVVITSTDRAFTELGVAVGVAVFARTESLDYLRERTGLADDTGAGLVADELGDLPLGLAQAAAAIRGQRLTYENYLQRLRAIPVGRLLGRVPGQDYPHGAAAALMLSIQAAETGDPTGLTGRLLRVLAVLSPDGVHRDILGGLPTGVTSDQAATRTDSWELDEALERCVAGSLLAWSVTGDAVVMHRLLGRVLRERDHANGDWHGTVSSALDLLEPLLFDEQHAWQRRVEGAHLVGQVEALASAGGTDTGDRDLDTQVLAARNWAVRQLTVAADLTRAITRGVSVLAAAERVLGADHPSTVGWRSNLAHAYQAAGRLGEAIPLFEEALTDFERVLGTDHPATLASRNNLAAAYQGAGRLGEAIPLFEEALTGRERLLGTDHPATLASRNNLANAHRAAGRLSEAIPLLEQTLADFERMLGTNHANTLNSRNNLAAAYQAGGRLGEAIPLYEQTLADAERARIDDHPSMLVSRNNLAGAYEAAGRVGEAIPLYERTLADREQVLGSVHPHTLGARSSLASAYRAAGRLGEAIPVYKRTLADTERVLGGDHPDTLTLRNNLASAYQAAGRLGEAIRLLERTLADRERVLGGDHPDTLASRDNLANARLVASQRSAPPSR